MEKRVEEIVRQVVSDYFNNKNNEGNQKKIFLMIEKSRIIPLEEMWQIVSDLSLKYDITLCLTDDDIDVPKSVSCKKSILLNVASLQTAIQWMQESDLIFLPNASFSTLAKLALTIDDCLQLVVLIQAQLEGKQLIVSKDFFTPKGSQKITTPHSIKERLHSYMKQLKQDKVKIISKNMCMKSMDSFFKDRQEERPIVLAKHLEESFQEGSKELIVPKNSLITPMCKEYAKDLGMLIKQKE